MKNSFLIVPRNVMNFHENHLTENKNKKKSTECFSIIKLLDFKLLFLPLFYM